MKTYLILVLGALLMVGCQQDKAKFTKEFGISWPTDENDIKAKSPVIMTRLTQERARVDQIGNEIEATNNMANALPADTHDQIEARREAFENAETLGAHRDDQIRECWRLYRIASDAGFGDAFMQSYLTYLPHDPDDPF